MKYLSVVALLLAITFSKTANAATDSSETLALRLWIAYDKETNASYNALDSYRLKFGENLSVKTQLGNPESFKKYQTILRNRFIDRVSKEFSRKEIINLTKIYKRPEMTKLRLFTMDFWDEDELKRMLSDDDRLPPPPPSSDNELPPLPPK